MLLPEIEVAVCEYDTYPTEDQIEALVEGILEISTLNLHLALKMSELLRN